MSKASDTLFRLKRTAPESWSVNEVATWLDFIQLSDYRAEFMKQQVSGAELFDLEAEDIAALGVKKIGHKKRLQKKIRQLKRGIGSAFDAGDDDTTSSASSGSNVSAGRSSNLSSSSKKSTKVTLKCYFKDDVTRIKFSRKQPIEKLNRLLRKEYGCRVLIKYKDEDGDMIRIRKDSHLKAAFEDLEGEVLKLYLSQRKKKVTKREAGVLDTMVNGIVTINKKGKIVFFNKAAEELWGYKRSQVLGKNVKVLMPPEIAREHDGYLARYNETGQSKIIGSGRPVQAKHADGHIFDIHLSLSEGTQNGVKQFMATVTKMADKGIGIEQITKNQFSLLDGMLDGAIVINEVGIIQYWNKAATKMFGYKPVDVIGKNIKLLMTSSDAAAHDGYLASYNKTGVGNIIGIGRDVVAVNKDGTMSAVHLSVTEQQLGGGKKFFTGIVRPVEEELNKRKTVLQQEREVLEGLVVPAIIIDESCKIHAYNDACAKLLGYTLLEVIGRNVRMLMPEDVAAKHDSFVRNYLQTGKAKVIGTGRDVTAKSKTGRSIRLHLSVTEKKDEDGKSLFTGILQPK
jgi:PAS domain S-box-containing protein